MKKPYTIGFIFIYMVCVLTAPKMDGRCPNRSGMTSNVNESKVTRELDKSEVTRNVNESKMTSNVNESEVTRELDKSEKVDNQQKRKIPFGYDGGMMLHTGFLTGQIREIGHKSQGMPFGIGGAIKFHIGKYFRIGSEGYVSTLKQLGNGSNIKFGWGGILADVRFDAGKLMPYVGLTIGGGARTSTLMLEGNNSDWNNEQSVILNRTPFMAIAPFIGTDIVMTKKFHLTVKVDYLCAINHGKMLMPTGPRLYFGFLMYH